MKKVFKTQLNLALCSALATSLMAPSAFAAYGLMDIYQLALEHDAVLAQAKASYEANQEVVTVAKSPLLPQVTGRATLGKTYSSSSNYDASTAQFSVALDQVLYNKSTFVKYDQSKLQLEKSEAEIKAAEQDIILRVANAYFNVLLGQEDVSLAKSKEEADKTQWERANASAEVGLASKTDVLQAKSSYDLSKSERINAENNLDVAYEQLMKLTGQSIESLKIVALNVNLPKPSLNIADWEARAEQDNLTVKQFLAASEIAQQEIEAQQSGHLPTAGLQASYTDSRYPDTSSVLLKDKQDTYIGAYVNVPIYSGGAVTSKIAEAKYQFKSSTEALRNAREQAKLEARVQVRSLERGLALVDALREAVKSNDAFLEAAEEGYKVGLKNLLEVLTARTNKFKARRDLTDALHKVILSGLSLEVAAGSLNADKLVSYDAILSEPTH